MNRNQLVLGGMVLIIGVGAIFLFGGTQITKQSVEKKIKVVTTLYPLYDFVKEIGGNSVEVTLLIPPGVEPHSFEPKPRDMITLNDADIFIYTGPLMETWAANIIKGVNNKKIFVVNASKDIHLIPAVSFDTNERVGALDPHIWLGLNNVDIIINEITQGLIQADEKNSTLYKKNAIEYQKKITALKADYSSDLGPCKKRTIVYGGHYTFGYLAREYSLTYLAAAGISSDAEPTVADLSRLVEIVKKEQIPYIFYQELSSPKVAETIAQETGAQLILLNGAHTVSKQDFEQGVSYIDIMKSNLQNLKKGLECN